MTLRTAPSPAAKRRTFLAGSAGAAGALAAPPILRAQASIVCSGSADEMLAPMQGSGRADHDLVSFDTSLFPQDIDGGPVKPMDPARLPAVANLARESADVPAVTTGDLRSGVPFARGSLPPVRDADGFPGPPERREAIRDPAHAQPMLWQGDADTPIAPGAPIVGAANPFRPTDDDVAAIRAGPIERKRGLPGCRAGFDDGADLFARNGRVPICPTGGPQVPALRAMGANAALTGPKERAAGWLDCREPSSGVTDGELAHAWIHARMAPAVGRVLTETLNCGNCTNIAADGAADLACVGRLARRETAANGERRVAVRNRIEAA